MKRLVFCFLLLTGCIETDIVNDEVIALSIQPDRPASNNTVSGLISEQISFSAEALNDRGITFLPDVSWSSSDPAITSIDENGVATLLNTGTVIISANAFGITSNAISLNVVSTANEVAMIVITSPKTSLAVGESIQLEAQAINVNNEPISDLTYTWSSTNSDILTVDDNGLVNAIANGMAAIEVQTEGVTSSIMLSVGMVSVRTGSFAGLNGYSVSGDADLTMDDNGIITINFMDNFSTSSGPGLYIYLSNSDNSVSGGVEISELRKNSGSDTYSVPDEVSFDQYSYILIYCKPFGVGFGAAQLN